MEHNPIKEAKPNFIASKFALYLKQVGLDGLHHESVQYIELRKAYYAAVGHMLVFIPLFEDSIADQQLTYMEQEVSNLFNNDSIG